MTAISVDNLSIELGEATVLDRVSFSVEQGEIFGLVGESGSGKSTILRCIAGLYRHWTGSIRADGVELQGAITPERSRLIQMVFQDPYGSLHPKQTVDTQLMEVMRVHRLDDRDRRVIQALALVGLNESFRFRYPHQLSGGQRQRVAIARALVVEPKILLLDEPTSALDVSVQAEVLNLLKDLQERGNLTYIIVSHDLAVINHMCSRFSVMQHGRIVETLSAQSIVDPNARLDSYTKILVQSSKRYDRSFAATLSAME